MAIPNASTLAAYTLAQQHPITASWSERRQRLALLTEDHEVDIDLATDYQLARLRRDRFASDQPAALFLNDWRELRPGFRVMLSVRYEGGRTDRPFIDVSALSEPIVEAVDIAAVAAVARERASP